MLLSFAGVASAAQCGDTDINGNIIQCGNGNPEMVVNGFGVMNSQVPHVKDGETVRDAAGFPSTCHAFYPAYCLDIFGTDVYKTQARFTAHQLQERGYSLGLWAFWLTH